MPPALAAVSRWVVLGMGLRGGLPCRGCTRWHAFERRAQLCSASVPIAQRASHHAHVPPLPSLGAAPGDDARTQRPWGSLRASQRRGPPAGLPAAPGRVGGGAAALHRRQQVIRCGPPTHHGRPASAPCRLQRGTHVSSCYLSALGSTGSLCQALCLSTVRAFFATHDGGRRPSDPCERGKHSLCRGAGRPMRVSLAHAPCPQPFAPNQQTRPE